MQRLASVARKVWYAGRSESVSLGRHTLKYLPGTRPVRLKYRDDPDITVRNDVLQIEYFIREIRKGQSVIDVGANVGQYAVLFGALVGPEGHVAAFEPQAEARALLSRNVRLNRFDHVKVEPLAVAERSEERVFYWRSGDQMSSLELEGFGRNSGDSDIQKTTVQTTSLDEYLESAELAEPDWLKIDAEGAEVAVLKGARRLLRGNTRILCELHPHAWEGFGTSYAELASIAKQSGRKIRYLDESRDIADGPGYGSILMDR